VDDAKRRAQFTYDAAAEFFDDPALGFWDLFGRSRGARPRFAGCEASLGLVRHSA